MNKELEDLVKIANSTDGLGNTEFDAFLRLNGYTTKDLTQRILIEDLYTFYAEYYHSIYKVLPHRNKFAEHSDILKKYKIRQRKAGDKSKLTWGLKCSVAFKESYLKFIESTTWLKRLQAIRNTKKSHKSRKINKRENKQLEMLLRTRASKKGTFLK